MLVIFFEHCMKGTLLSFLTGNNYYKTKVWRYQSGSQNP